MALWRRKLRSSKQHMAMDRSGVCQDLVLGKSHEVCTVIQNLGKPTLYLGSLSSNEASVECIETVAVDLGAVSAGSVVRYLHVATVQTINVLVQLHAFCRNELPCVEMESLPR
jgi:hypothetical protein